MTDSNRTDVSHFASMRAAAAASGVPFAVLKGWKDAGLPGFDRSGRVDLKTVLTAVFSKPDDGVAPPPGMRNWREALNKAQAQRQELKLATERGHLIERAFMATRIQVASGELHAIRVKSESEDALKFAETNGDIPECRAILRGIWDGVFLTIQKLSKHFDENTETKA